MKLHEIKSQNYRPQHSSFKVEGYDGLEPVDTSTTYGSFDVHVEYVAIDNGYDDHPYGDGTVREYHGIDVDIISLTTINQVTQFDFETDEIVKTFPAGTDLTKMSGWTDKNFDYFEELARHDFHS
jgi:hypothetical protein